MLLILNFMKLSNIRFDLFTYILLLEVLIYCIKLSLYNVLKSWVAQTAFDTLVTSFTAIL